MRFVVCLVLILTGLSYLAATAPAYALQTPKSSQRDKRIKLIAYDPADIVKIVGYKRISTEIVFADGEEISFIAGGDSVSWDFRPAGHILFLKPREAQPQTNINLVTIRANGKTRSYQFELNYRDGNPSSDPETSYLIRFEYPADEDDQKRAEADQKKSGAELEKADLVLDYHQNHGPRNYAYTAQGSTSLQPATVYDDGKATVFRFIGNSEFPAIYIVNADGTEGLINKSVQDDLIIVQAIAPKFILRSGAEVVCVFNESYDRAGINPGTGTTSPSVLRTIKKIKGAK